jgi:chemotaxis protein CheC
VTPRYTELQLDALRELANIASGNAATALSQLLGREVGVSVPRVLALPLADVVEACGRPDESTTSVVIPLEGDIEGIVLLLISTAGAHALCQLLGVDAGSEIGDSALREIGNILGTSCLNALASMTGLSLGPCPPHLTTDMLGAIVSSLALSRTKSPDPVLVLDSELDVAGEPCSISFVLLPTDGGVTDLLTPLGLAA